MILTSYAKLFIKNSSSQQRLKETQKNMELNKDLG